jgi:hypothetical protein
MLVANGAPSPAPAARSAAAAAPAQPALNPGERWSLESMSVHVAVDLSTSSLRGSVQLTICVPGGVQPTEVRLHCASACVVRRCLVDGVPVEPTQHDADCTEEVIVPARWRRTRDLASYQRCHGAATFLGSHQFWDEPASGRCFHGGQLVVPLPLPTAAASTEPASTGADAVNDTSSANSAADPAIAGGASATEAAAPADGRKVTLHVEYVISEPRGGVHFVRPHGGSDAPAVYAHTVSEAGAARRWMPCVDCVQVRCPVQLHVTADEDLYVHATGQPLGETVAANVLAGAADSGSGLPTTPDGPASTGAARRPRLRTRSFSLDHPVTASQIGFVVGRLATLPHPALPHVTLVIGTLTNDGSGSRDARWAQMLYLSRQLPSLFQFLRSHLLGPSAAVAMEAAVTADEAAAAADEAANGAASAAPTHAAPLALQRHPSRLLQAKAWGGSGRGSTSGPAEADAALRDPFTHHTIVALEGCFEEIAAFAGLVVLDAHLLHPPEVIEPARPLRLALGRALGRSWLWSGVWLSSWRDAWLLMALEGRLVHGLVAHEFGADEAVHRLMEERRELCRTSLGDANVALVPDEGELALWGGGLHPEQLFSAHRARKAPLVWRMLESAVKRTDGGKRAFMRILARLVVFPPPTARPMASDGVACGVASVAGGASSSTNGSANGAAHGSPSRGAMGAAAGASIPAGAERIRSTEGLLRACIAAGAKLGTLPSEWIFSAKPCPMLRANFAYNHSQHKVELVLVQPPASEAAQLGDLPLTVGWGEPDGDGARTRVTNPPIRLNSVERHKLVELSVSLRGRRRRKRLRPAEGEDAEEGAQAVAASNLPLLWVRIDPHMDVPLSVQWTGRLDEPRWTGMPETMCAEQLLHDHDIASRMEAAEALATFKTHSSIDALATCMRDATAYFRVRTAAATALGSMSEPTTEFAALHRLIRRVRQTCFEGGSLKPNDFSDLGEYALLKALVEAIGTCRDAGGRTPPEACELLVEMLEDNDNSANAFGDDYYLAALLRALAATRGGRPGASRTATAQVTRLLRLDALRKTHERVLSRAALQALATLELERCGRVNDGDAEAEAQDEHSGTGTSAASSGGGAEPSWNTYWHYERTGECAALRLTAADCLLRLSLLLPPTKAAHAECRPVLGLALRLASARAHAPLEQLWLWSALLTLLVEPSHHAAVERERARLGARGGSTAIAAVQLLWHAMTEGAAGHARLRYVLCEVWRCLFGEAAPGCLPFAPQSIGWEQVGALPDGYVPLHTIRQRRSAEVEARRAAGQPKQSLKMKLHVNDAAGMITRFDMTTGAESATAAARPQAVVRFASASVHDERVADLLPGLEREYRQRAEHRLTFACPTVDVTPHAPPDGAYGAYGVPPGSAYYT